MKKVEPAQDKPETESAVRRTDGSYRGGQRVHGRVGAGRRRCGSRRALHLEASTALKSILTVGERVRGEPFTVGSGIHNVHQNQVDPPTRNGGDENGIWQDGGVASLGSDSEYQIFLPKFSTQADRTDDHGHPTNGTC